jgi:hypothetical protein
MEAGQSAAPEAPDALVQALRLEGVHQVDPVRFHYIEVLAARAGAYEGPVRRVLDAKLQVAAAALRASCVQARSGTATTESADPRPSLGDLVHHMAAHSLDKPDGRAVAHTTPRTELKSVQFFRNTWSKLSAEKQVTRALEQAPKNAGPINSHVVALRSLSLMRDTAPDYLNRFTTYVDTLLSLEQGEKAPPPAVKPLRVAKPKPGPKARG